MGLVTNTLTDASGRGLQDVTVRIKLIAPLNPFLINGVGEILTQVAVDTDHDGVWTALLAPNSTLDQSNAYYVVDESDAPGGLRWPIAVPDGAGPFNLRDLLIPVPPTTNPDGPVTIRPGGSFEWDQLTPASIWTIPHDLGYKPGGVRVKDSAGSDWYGWSITDADVNTVIIDLGVSMAGTAELS